FFSRHFRLQIISGYFRRLRHFSLFAIKRLFAVIVKKESNMSKLFRLGAAKLGKPAPGQNLAADIFHFGRFGKSYIYWQTLFISCHAYKFKIKFFASIKTSLAIIWRW